MHEILSRYTENSGNTSLTPEQVSSHRLRRNNLALLGIGVVAAITTAGCASSPEFSQVLNTVIWSKELVGAAFGVVGGTLLGIMGVTEMVEASNLSLTPRYSGREITIAIGGAIAASVVAGATLAPLILV